MSEPRTSSEILDAAADYIEQHGFIKGAYCLSPKSVQVTTLKEALAAPDGPVCAEGALIKTYGPQYAITDAFAWIAEEAGTAPGRELVPWNDDPSTTASDVINAYRRAAQRAREEQQHRSAPSSDEGGAEK